MLRGENTMQIVGIASVVNDVFFLPFGAGGPRFFYLLSVAAGALGVEIWFQRVGPEVQTHS